MKDYGEYLEIKKQEDKKTEMVMVVNAIQELGLQLEADLKRKKKLECLPETLEICVTQHPVKDDWLNVNLTVKMKEKG